MKGGEIDTEGDVGWMLLRADQCELALADAEEGPGLIGVEDLGIEVVDVELDGGGNIGSGDGDVVHFEHGGYSILKYLRDGEEEIGRTSFALQCVDDGQKNLIEPRHRDRRERYAAEEESVQARQTPILENSVQFFVR